MGRRMKIMAPGLLTSKPKSNSGLSNPITIAITQASRIIWTTSAAMTGNQTNSSRKSNPERCAKVANLSSPAKLSNQSAFRRRRRS